MSSATPTKLEECEKHWYANRKKYEEWSARDANYLLTASALGQPVDNATLQAFRGMHDDAWEAGARWALRQSSSLSPHIGRFIEMLILLGMCDDEPR